MEYFVEELNFESVKFVCVVCDDVEVKDEGCMCYVVGILGFMNCMVFIFLDVNDLVFWNVFFDDLCEIYKVVLLVLVRGGVDIFMVEMIFDMLNVKVVFFVIEEVYDELGFCLLIMIFGIIID